MTALTSELEVVPRSWAGPPQRDRWELRSTGFLPFEAKLRAPVPREGLVVRRKLLDRLAGSCDVPIVLMTAPAGYGRTSLLAQWAAEDQRPFGWLSLDAADNDPVVLATYVTLALHRVDGAEPSVLAPFPVGESAASTVGFPCLARMLAQRRQPLVLALDDVHVLETPQCLELLMVIADHLPAGSQLALATRRTPRLPLGRLRAHRSLLTIGAEDLALNHSESEALLQATGLDLRGGDLNKLVEHTEGWPTGLYLAGVALRDERDVQAAVESFTGDHRVVADYLRDELLDQVPPDLAAFLTRTSVMDRFCGPLCDAVLGGSGAGAVLRELERSNLLIVPLDHQHRWYRYHRMFASMLRGELRRLEPELEPELHRRSALWSERHGDIETSVRHAQAAGDVERAARLVWSEVPAFLATGRRATLERWLRGFTAEEIRAHAKLALTAAWCALETGRSADHLVSAAERGGFDASIPREAESVASALAALRAVVAAHGIKRMEQDAELAERLAAPGSRWPALCRFLTGIAAHLAGDGARARERLESAAELCAFLDMPSLHALCLAQLALLSLEQDDWEQAGRLATKATTALERHGLSEVVTLGPVYAISALVLAQQRREGEAQRHAQHARRMIELAHLAPWFSTQAKIVLSRAHVLLGDSAAACVLLSETRRQLPLTPDASVLGEWFDATRRMVEGLPLASHVGRSSLTTAEIRVLHYLPTYLSFQEIGNRLHVSRNTVKTQAISAYRKLGVTSRREAVEHAHVLGLIRA